MLLRRSKNQARLFILEMNTRDVSVIVAIFTLSCHFSDSGATRERNVNWNQRNRQVFITYGISNSHIIQAEIQWQEGGSATLFSEILLYSDGIDRVNRSVADESQTK